MEKQLVLYDLKLNEWEYSYVKYMLGQIAAAYINSDGREDKDNLLFYHNITKKLIDDICSHKGECNMLIENYKKNMKREEDENRE